MDLEHDPELGSSADMTGQSIGGYRLESLLGAGGMGEVYRSRDTKLGRDVAIKILPRAFTSHPDRLARFEREARMLAALNHTNICAIYGFEQFDGIRFLILELVEGDTLAQTLAQVSSAHAKGEGLPLGRALHIARQITDALEVAHDKGIVHRDLKPGNIKITSDGAVKVLDFGLAKTVGGDGSGSDLTSAPEATRGEPGQGAVIGTAAYMSPEQARGLPVDKRTDIWAFGCVLYEMLTGRVTFAGDTISDSIAKILEREPDWSALPPGTPIADSTAAAPMPDERSQKAAEGHRRRPDRDRCDRRSAAWLRGSVGVCCRKTGCQILAAVGGARIAGADGRYAGGTPAGLS